MSSNRKGPNPVSRRSFLKTTVAKGTAGIAVAAAGLHPKEAEASHHLAYEKVVLSPGTARALGYDVSEDATAVKVSGRKGLGVKADDLMDLLVDKARAEIASRGFVSDATDDEILREARGVVALSLNDTSREERTDEGLLKAKIQAGLRSFLRRRTQKRPLIIPVIVEL